MSHTELVDTLFLKWLAEQDAVNYPRDVIRLAEQIADDPEVIAAYREQHPEKVQRETKRSLDSLMLAAVNRRFWFSTNTKNPKIPPTTYYHNGNAKNQLFRLYPDWEIRFKHKITDKVCPTEESIPALAALVRHYNHSHFSQSRGNYPEAVRGVCGVMFGDKCVFCGVEKSDSVPLDAAHIFARKWSKALSEKENFDSFNGLRLCDGCHKSFDNLEISTAVLPGDSGFRWTRINGSVGDVLIPQDGDGSRGNGRLLDFIDLRNFYLENSRHNSLKTKEL